MVTLPESRQMSCCPSKLRPRNDQWSVRFGVREGCLCLSLLLCGVGCRESPLGKLDLAALAAKGDVAKIKQAIQAGAKLDAVDAHGYTALSVAAFNGQKEAVSVLLDSGANPDAGFPPFRPLSLAAAQSNLEMVKLLIDRGAKAKYPKEEEQPIVFATAPEIIAHLVQFGADVNIQGGASKETALHRSAAVANPRAIQTLLASGANPKLADANGWTPLHVLCRIRNAELLPGARERIRDCLKLLLDAGADPNAIDNFQSTPLHQAARSPAFGIEELRLLVKAGGRKDLKNGMGRTPAMVAQFNGFSYDKARLDLLSGGSKAYLSK